MYTNTHHHHSPNTIVPWTPLVFSTAPQKKKAIKKKKNSCFSAPSDLEDVLLQQWQKASRATGYWSLHVPSTPLTLRSAGLALRGHGGRLIGWCCWWQLGGGLLSCGPFSLGFTTLNGKCCYASFPTKKWGAILKKDYFGVEREVKLHLWILEGFVEKKLPRKSRKHVATFNFLICEPN